MRSRKPGVLLAIVLLIAASGFAFQPAPGPPGQPLSPAVLARLPADWRAAVEANIRATAVEQARFLTLSDVVLRQVLVRLLARVRAADTFVEQQLSKDPAAAVRTTIVQAIAGDSRWTAKPGTITLIERVVVSDPDPAVSIAALEVLRRPRLRPLNALLNERVALAKRSGDKKALARLAEEQERWFLLERGTMLPSFLATPPPVFAVTGTDSPVRVLAFGDFGTGSPEQKALAQTISTYHGTRRFDLALTLGDNFYSFGMASPDDPRWQTQFEQLYGGLGVTFYPTLGNHDWGWADSPAAEILYSGKTTTWRMPAAYYTFTAGPVQFFALDTQSIAFSEKQRQWLDEALARSQARWKVVYGHHPIYSGGAYEDRPDLIRTLLPLLRNRADIYLCGHDHNLQAIQADAGVHFYVAGGGGAGLYELRSYERSVFASRTNGFAVLDADTARLTVSLVDGSGRTLYENTLRKPVTTSSPGQ